MLELLSRLNRDKMFRMSCQTIEENKQGQARNEDSKICNSQVRSSLSPAYSIL